MTPEIRWRIVALQAVFVLILGAAGAFALYEGHFVTGMVTDQLSAQKIFFPPPSEIKAGGALDPAEFPQEIRDQAGKQVTTGDQAKIYADDFIGKHLESVANGQTYSQVSSQAIALQSTIATTPPASPTYGAMQARLATLNGQRATLFQGEMLRATLLNSYGWWTVGIDATYAGYALVLAAIAVFCALIFEIVLAVRAPSGAGVTQKSAA